MSNPFFEHPILNSPLCLSCASLGEYISGFFIQICDHGIANHPRIPTQARRSS
jgi:hypothetical protein